MGGDGVSREHLHRMEDARRQRGQRVTPVRTCGYCGRRGTRQFVRMPGAVGYWCRAKRACTDRRRRAIGGAWR